MDSVKIENGDESTIEYKKNIHNFACALLQIGQAVDPKYFKPPFGSLKAGKNGKEAAQEKAKKNFDLWCVSLMNSINTSQLFLHYNVLYDAIKWTRSVQNAKCVCRSNRDPDKLILCDGCNLGRHIYCLKPKLTVSYKYNSYVDIQMIKFDISFIIIYITNRKCLKAIGTVTNANQQQLNHREKNARDLWSKKTVMMKLKRKPKKNRNKNLMKNTIIHSKFLFYGYYV